MNFDQLRYFVSIAQTLNYSRSSQVLNVTQPALSLSISRLEEEIGYPLFIKKGRNIELSPYGERFSAYANTILNNMTTALKDLATIAEQSTQSVSIALNICFNYDYSFKIFQDFCNTYPQYLTDTMILDHSEIVSGLQHGDFSFAVTHISPAIDEDDNLATLPLAEYPLFIFVSEDNPLTQYAKVMPEMISESNMLVGTFAFKATSGNSSLYPSKTTTVVPDIQTMMQFVSENKGVTTGNYTYTQEMKDKGIVRIPYGDRITHYILAWNKNRILSNADIKFLEYCTNYVKTKPLDITQV